MTLFARSPRRSRLPRMRSLSRHPRARQLLPWLLALLALVAVVAAFTFVPRVDAAAAGVPLLLGLSLVHGGRCRSG